MALEDELGIPKPSLEQELGIPVPANKPSLEDELGIEKPGLIMRQLEGIGNAYESGQSTAEQKLATPGEAPGAFVNALAPTSTGYYQQAGDLFGRGDILSSIGKAGKGLAWNVLEAASVPHAVLTKGLTAAAEGIVGGPKTAGETFVEAIPSFYSPVKTVLDKALGQSETRDKWGYRAALPLDIFLDPANAMKIGRLTQKGAISNAIRTAQKAGKLDAGDFKLVKQMSDDAADILPREKITRLKPTAGGMETYDSNATEVLTFLRDRAENATARKRLNKLLKEAEKLEGAGESIPLLPTEMMNERALRSYGMVEDALAVPGASAAISEKTYKKYLGGGNPFKWGGFGKFDKSGTQFGIMAHMQGKGYEQDIINPYRKADQALKQETGFTKLYEKATPVDRQQWDTVARDYLSDIDRQAKEVPMTARFEPGDPALDQLIEPPTPAGPPELIAYLKGARKLKEKMEMDAIARGEHVALRPLFNEAFDERLTEWAQGEAQKARSLKAELTHAGLSADEVTDELAQMGMSTSPIEHIKRTVWDRIEAYGSPEKYIASNTWLDHPAFDPTELARKGAGSREEMARILEEIQKIKTGEIDPKLAEYRKVATSKQIADKAYGAGKGYVRGQNLVKQSRGVAEEGAAVIDEATAVKGQINEAGDRITALLADPTIPMKDKIDAAAAEANKAADDFILNKGRMFDAEGRLTGVEDGPENIYHTRWANPHEASFARSAKPDEIAQIEKEWAKGEADHLEAYIERYKHGRGPAEQRIIFQDPTWSGDTPDIAKSLNIKGINTDRPDWYSLPGIAGKRKATIISTLRKMEAGDIKGMTKAERGIYNVLVDVRHEDLAHGHLSGKDGFGTVQNDAYREALISHVIAQEARPFMDARDRFHGLRATATPLGEKEAARTAGDVMRWGDMRRRLDAKSGDLMNRARGMREKGRTGMAEGEIGHFQARTEPGKVQVRKLVEDVAKLRSKINELKKAAHAAERNATTFEQGAAGLDEMRMALHEAGGGPFQPKSVQRHVRRAISPELRQKVAAWKEAVGANPTESDQKLMDALDGYVQSAQFNPSNTLSLGVKTRTDAGKVRSFSEWDADLRALIKERGSVADMLADARIAGGQKMKTAEALADMLESAGLFDRDLFNLVDKSITQHGRRAYTNHLLKTALSMPYQYVHKNPGTAIPHGFVPLSDVFAGAGDEVKDMIVNKDFAKYLNHANSYVSHPEGVVGKTWSVLSTINNWQRKTMLGWPATMLRNAVDAVSKTLLFHGPANTFHGLRMASTIMADNLDEVAPALGATKVKPFLEKSRQFMGGRSSTIVTKAGVELTPADVHRLATRHGIYLGGNAYALDTAKGLLPVKEGESALKSAALKVPRKLGAAQGAIIDTSGAIETMNRLAAFTAELIEGADPATAASRAHGMHWTGAMPDELISMLPESVSGTARAAIKDTITFFNFQRRNVPFWWKKMFTQSGRATAIPIKLKTNLAASEDVEPIPSEMHPYLTEQQAKSPFALGMGTDRKGDPAIKTIDLGNTLSELDALNIANLDVMSQAVPLLQLAGVGQQMAKSAGDPAGMHADHPYFGTDMRGGDLARYVAGQVMPPANKFNRFAESTGITNTDRYPDESPVESLLQTMVYPFRTKEIGIGGIEHRVGKEWNPKINALEDQIDIAYSRGDTKEAERLQAMLDEATFGEEDAMQAVMDYMNRNTQRGIR